MSADQAAHVTRAENITRKAQMKRLEHYNRWHRIALAFSEYKHAQEHRFPTEVIECDTARFGTTRCSDGARMHTGRTLVLKGRQSKQWTCQPLPPKISYGKRGIGPETISEVRPAIQLQTPLTALLGVDGAKAWPAAAGPRLILGGVNHQKKVFTPASAVSKKGLKKPTAQFLARQSRGKKKGAASYKQHYRVAGGDHAVQGTFGMISNCLRKTNSRGRNAKSKTRTLLAQPAATLVKRPGVNNILSANKTYREALLTGSLGLSPQQAFKLEKLTWLIPTEAEERDTEN